MKPIFLFLCAAAVTAWAAAQQPASRATDSEPTTEEIQTIRKILELPPERLARMRSAIEKMERMSPESRREFAANLAKYEACLVESSRVHVCDEGDWVDTPGC